MKRPILSAGLTRRQMLKLGLVTGGAALLPITYKSHKGLRVPRAIAGGTATTPSNIKNMITPFAQDMPVPPVLGQTTLIPTPGSYGPVGNPDVFHGIAPEFFVTHPAHCDDWNAFKASNIDPPPSPSGMSQHRFESSYLITMVEVDDAQIIPEVSGTEVFAYNGISPGPTIVARFREPIVVRHVNQLPFETSVHLHGGHIPAHSDGYPDFYVLPGKARDYFYPNIVRRSTTEGCGEPFEISEVPSTMWYHDHGMDLTGRTVSHGLAAFYLLHDDLEDTLIANHVLPALPAVGPFDHDTCFDVPIALTDQLFDGDGKLFYDFFDHNGRIGDVFTVNGKVQPRFHVRKRQYRFRILNTSNARIYHLRLSTGQPFLIVGTDSWLLPFPVVRQSFQLAMAERQDVIVDFRNVDGNEVYLENIMQQNDGRKPDKVDPSKPTRLIKFIVVDEPAVDNLPGLPVADMMNGTVGPETVVLREHVPIEQSEITTTRHFVFDRSHGAWTINNQFFSPRRADAVPTLNADGEGGHAEKWILENKSGGWWHPIHIHVDSHHIQRLNGELPPEHRRYKVDVSTLIDNGVAEVFIKFGTFTGPFVFHCHNLEHEDMRMMAAFDPRVVGDFSVLNGVDEIPQDISGIPAGWFDVQVHREALSFEQLGDVDRLEGRGVGIPHDDFEAGGETVYKDR